MEDWVVGDLRPKRCLPIAVIVFLMLRPHAAHFLYVADTLAQLERFDPNAGDPSFELLGEQGTFVGWVRAILPGVSLIVKGIPLPMVEAQLERIRDIVNTGPVRKDRLVTAIAELKNRMHDELRALRFLHVPPDLVPFHTEKELFGDTVAQKFPALSDDIEAAGRCLAVGEATACVFHLMRVVEGAVRALAAKLHISNVQRAWGPLLTDIDDQIKQMPSGDDKIKWSEARVNLYHVKQAWRNETMHPKQNYTIEQAKEIFAAMKTFTQHLAGLT